MYSSHFTPIGIFLPDVEMPKNCHECDAFGISDVIGLKCPCKESQEVYDFEKRPSKCPLEVIRGYSPILEVRTLTKGAQ